MAHDHKDPSLAQSSLKLREGIISASRVRCATGTTLRNFMGGFSEPGMLCLPLRQFAEFFLLSGRVLEHDDTDSDSGRQELCIEGILHLLSKSDKNDTASDQYQSIIQLPEKTLIEVMVEIVEVRDLPAEHDGGLSVIISKKRPDLYFNGRRMSILSKAGKRDVAVFRCEPTGELIFKFLSYPSSVSHIASPARMLGTASISLYDLMKTGSPLSIEKCFALMPISGIIFNENGGQRNCFPKKEVIGMTSSGESLVLAEFAGTGWFDEFQLVTIVFPGRKLEYEIKCENYKHEQNFMIAVKFSAEYPHGKAVALFDLKSTSLKVNEEWVGFPGILLAFLLSDTSRNGQFNTDGESAKQMGNNSEQYANTSSEEDKTTSQIQDMEDTAKAATQEPCKSRDKCDCGVVAQVEVMGGKGSGVVKNVTGEENYSNGSKAVVNGGARSHLLGLVYSDSGSHIILEDEAEGAHCGGCGSCHGGCGGCVSQSASSIFPGDVANAPQCGGCGSCHGGCGGCGSCHGGSCGQDQQYLASQLRIYLLLLDLGPFNTRGGETGHGAQSCQNNNLLLQL
ncbi:hypothetical protein OIU85_021074 [Salix viminalis]|uniref:Uncharacterized protein n=1 Tax=Salix viminalis TaxID=40686 RepID=A0A9Q0ZD90_SALVM|nr:hypothetical protein OIU85_021074 [Salix viminalis]